MANNHRPGAAEYHSGHLGKSFAAGFAGPVDLRVQVGYPKHAPAFAVVTNNDLTASVTTAGSTPAIASQDFVFKDLGGNSCTVKVPQQYVQEVDCVMSTLETSGANISVTVFWWVDSSTVYNA